MTRLARIMNTKLPLKVCFDVGQKSRGVVTPKADTPSVWHEYLILRVKADVVIDGAMSTLTQSGTAMRSLSLM